MQSLSALARVENGVLLMEPQQVLNMDVGPASLDVLKTWWEFSGFALVPLSLDMTAPSVRPELVRLRVSSTHATMVCSTPEGDVEIAAVHGDANWSRDVIKARECAVLVCEGVLPDLSDALLRAAAAAGGLVTASVRVLPA